MEPRNNIRALVIEDDQEMATLLKRIIASKFSIEVEVAFDCTTARRKMDEREYDLITLDYRLPDGAGLDLLDEITGDGKPHPPVIMVTGHGDEDTAARSFRSRASGYVVKDAKLPELLIEAVKKALAEISLKRVERELLDEKVFIEDALNGLPDLFAVVDMDGKFFRWNQKVCEITGFTNTEISNMTIPEIFREEDRERLIEGMQLMCEEDFSVDEVVLETKSGEQRYYELSGRLLRNFNGIPIGFSGIGRDITDRVAANRELMRYRDELEALVEERTAELLAANERHEHELAERVRAEEHYRSILENSMDVLAIFDAQAVIVDISPSIEPLLGYAPEEMKGKNVLEFVHPDDLAGIIGTHENVATGVTPSSHANARFKHRDGSWHTLSAVGRLYTGHGGEVRVIVNARDISDVERAQQSLAESEERYRRMFELSPDFVFLMDPSGMLIDANDALLERLGVSSEEFTKRDYLHFLSGDYEAEVGEAVERLRAGHEVRGIEFQARTAYGVDHMYEVNAIPIIEEGEVKRILALARDITGRKTVEDELIKLNRELEGYAQTVSHDLRSPLTAIKLAGDNLQTIWNQRDKVEDLDAEISRISEVVLASAGQAEELIADLLVLAKAGQEPEDVSEVDISATVQRIIEEHAPVIAERKVTMIVAEDLGTVRANPTQIYQLFSNLIDNGIEHNSSEEPIVEVNFLGKTPAGNAYVVKDNGPGISPEDAENIFMPFYKGEEGSTGIGLTIVDKLVAVYGGSISVTTNGGACFEFTLQDR